LQDNALTNSLKVALYFLIFVLIVLLSLAAFTLNNLSSSKIAFSNGSLSVEGHDVYLSTVFEISNPGPLTLKNTLAGVSFAIPPSSFWNSTKPLELSSGKAISVPLVLRFSLSKDEVCKILFEDTLGVYTLSVNTSIQGILPLSFYVERNVSLGALFSNASFSVYPSSHGATFSYSFFSKGELFYPSANLTISLFGIGGSSSYTISLQGKPNSSVSVTYELNTSFIPSSVNIQLDALGYTYTLYQGALPVSLKGSESLCA
jgi:hypothetical protein